MDARWMVVVALAATGCSKKSEAPAAGSGSGSGAGSGAGSAVAAVADAAAVVDASARCELAGKYRVRFTWNGIEGYWLRFTVAGGEVKLDVAPHMLQLADKLDAALDATACTIAMTGARGTPAEQQVRLQIDPATHRVTGELVRPGEKDSPRHTTPIAGVHDVAPAAPPAADACFEPGVYAIAIDKQHVWTNTAEGDDRSCKKMPDYFEPILVRVEWLGTELTVDTVEDKPPYQEKVLTTEELSRGGPCEVTLKTEPEGVQLEGKLTFAPGGKVTGVATRAEYRIVEYGDVGEDIWSCEARGIPLTIKRVASP